MTDQEWVRLDAPPPMPDEGEVVEIEIVNPLTGSTWHYTAKYRGCGLFRLDNSDLTRTCLNGGSVVAWRRKK